MTNETNLLLQSILEMDRQERTRTQATEEYRSQAMADLEATRKTIAQKHEQLARQAVENYTLQEAQRERSAMEKLQTKSAAVSAALKAKSAAMASEWVEEITRRALER